MNLKIGKVFFVITLLFSTHAFATAYTSPSANQSLIGQIQYGSTESGDTVATVAQRYDLGYNAIEMANPHLDMKRAFIAGAPLQLSTQHLLPNQPRNG
ncbi:MAG: hypothetical protein JO149_01960, partial [Gammaproteobacteria bacterium]|nr:hypothetical protein [Gammaproteobacteria bacterium]